MSDSIYTMSEEKCKEVLIFKIKFLIIIYVCYMGQYHKNQYISPMISTNTNKITIVQTWRSL